MHEWFMERTHQVLQKAPGRCVLLLVMALLQRTHQPFREEIGCAQWQAIEQDAALASCVLAACATPTVFVREL